MSYHSDSSSRFFFALFCPSHHRFCRLFCLVIAAPSRISRSDAVPTSRRPNALNPSIVSPPMPPMRSSLLCLCSTALSSHTYVRPSCLHYCLYRRLQSHVVARYNARIVCYVVRTLLLAFSTHATRASLAVPRRITYVRASLAQSRIASLHVADACSHAFTPAPARSRVDIAHFAIASPLSPHCR